MKLKQNFLENKMNKSKLMKRAWEIAQIGFYDEAFRSIGDDMRASTIQSMIDQDDDMKTYDFNKPSIKKKMWIRFTKQDFFAESLKKAWSELKVEQKLKTANKNAPRRELVVDGKYEIGQKLLGFIVTGLGQSFRPNSDMFSWGISPDTDYVQYAYFN